MLIVIVLYMTILFVHVPIFPALGIENYFSMKIISTKFRVDFANIRSCLLPPVIGSDKFCTDAGSLPSCGLRIARDTRSYFHKQWPCFRQIFCFANVILL